jgi:hypothetical protein
MVFPAEANIIVGNATVSITAQAIKSYVAANIPPVTIYASTGTAPFVISSTTLVPNLYVARANVADTTTNGLSTSTTFAGTGDATITGNYSALVTTLSTVNSTPGTFGGKLSTAYVIPSIQVNSKGLITGVANVFITTPQFQGLTTSADILPTANLSVNLGSATAWFNNIYGTAVHAQYADLAENYESDVEYPPGTVVVFGDETEVTISTGPNDRRVAGVVSTAPAYLMNKSQAGVSVALQGRVPCQVIGNIRRGDMLVTSQFPGVAMVNNDPRPGTVIGKALQDYTAPAVGVIEVVVGRL